MSENSRQITLVGYDSTWPQVAERLMDSIMEACEATLIAVEHIGSTSVPGLAAKPVIDLAPITRSDDYLDYCVEPIATLGLEHRGEYGIPGRRYFRGTDPESGLDVHPHLFARDSVYLHRHLLLRDYLREHEEEAAAYAALKRGLAGRLWRDGNEYAEAKTPFIAACLERAERWAASSAWSPPFGNS